jgi:hypothetical protein
MNRTYLPVALAALLGSGWPSLAQAESTNLCSDPGVVFAFMNGVQTTPDGANEAKTEFQRLFGDTSPAGDPINYEVLYNYSNGFEDFVETFEQRLHEQEGLLEGRLELFFEALKGGGPWWDTLVKASWSAQEVLESFVDWYEAETLNNVTKLVAAPPTSVNYAEHRARIESWVIEGKKLLFVAHSQGNLFANAAYDFALTKTPRESATVVHIAPASPTLRGPHALADLDLVVNGLRPFGTVAPVTDAIPGYLNRSAGISGQKDILGHGLLEIYINERLQVSGRVFGHISAALNDLKAPPIQAASGFFTATLTWNGSGDADLHVLEASGAHVFFHSPVGYSGYLDIDNRSGFGPEHYYASCDESFLGVGEYLVAIANYEAADGREATVQVASWDEGVLGTKTVVLGGATEEYPGYLMFKLEIVQDEETGEYRTLLVE